MKHIVSFSGGKDSTAMLLRMIELKMPIDEILYFDCAPWEFPQTSRHIVKVEKFIGQRITTLRPKKDFDWWMLKYRPKNTKYPGIKGKGFPQPNLRWCTGLKRDIMRKYQNSLGEFTDYVGFAYDEQNRLKPYNYRGKIEKYPLVDWKWTEQDWKDIQTALKNYLESERVAKDRVQDGKTWFNNWGDWLKYKEPVCPKCRNTGKYISTTGFEIVCSCPKGKAIKIPEHVAE